MKLLSTTIFLLFTILFSQPSEAATNLFGKNAELNNDIEEFPKWISVLNKKTEELTNFEKKCTKDNKLFYCNIKTWNKFLSTLKGKTRIQQLEAINSYANEHKYILDINNWGISDYWESPGEFLLKNGDCEDYAIAKYVSLKQLGFDVNNLKVVVLMDKNLNIYHSVLAVTEGEDTYILDNQIKNITKSSNIFHYDPVYSINEKSWWRYF